MPRPRTGETPIRHVRVPDALWDQIAVIARGQQRTITAVVLDALEKYVAEEDAEQAGPPGRSGGRNHNGTTRRGTGRNEAG
jgi:hypothetical protein